MHVPKSRAAMPHKPSVKFSILSSAAGSAQIAVSSQSGDCSVTDEFQSTHLRLTRLVNSELTAACMHAAVTAGCDDLQNGRGSQYCGARILAPSGNASLLVLGTESRMGLRPFSDKRVIIFAPRELKNGWTFGPRVCARLSVSISISGPRGCGGVAAPVLQR